MTPRWMAFAVSALVAAASAPAFADDPLSVFQPQAAHPVAVAPMDLRLLRALPPLDAFGTLRGDEHGRVRELATAVEASRAAGYAIRMPARLPAGVGDEAPRFFVTEAMRTSFTFQAARAAAWAREHHVALQPVPRGLDGATYSATLQPVTVAVYGFGPNAWQPAAGARRQAMFALAEAPLPTLATRGAALADLVAWFAAQPGMPPRLVAQVKAIGDPSRTLPVPVPFDPQSATKVQVDGVTGFAIGDETGIGSAIVWTKNGKLFAVGGTLTQSELRAVVDSLGA